MLVTNLLQTKEVNSLKDVAQERSFELSATELLNLKTIIVCIYIYIYHQMQTTMNSYTN
jgi:hypothetical protein